jgi:diguanylate cyclase (GGDEF)-like protein
VTAVKGTVILADMGGMPTLLPLIAGRPHGERRIVLTAATLLLGVVTATAVQAVLGVGGAGVTHAFRDWGSSAVYILTALIVTWRAVTSTLSRRSWGIFALGISLYGLGNVLWAAWVQDLPNPPIPSVCDGLWLTLYPASYIGLAGFARARARRMPAGVWLDGVIAGLGLAAIGAAIVFPPLLASATGSPTAVVTELAYPIGDLLLAALVVGILAVGGWRLDRMWTMLGGGFLLLATADVMYGLQVAGGASTPSPLTNLTYICGTTLLALAAWQPEAAPAADVAPPTSVLLIPAGFTLAVLGLLVADHFHRLDPLALTLAMLTMVAAIVRTGLTFRDVRALATTRREALTDDLTSLPNRRHFLRHVREGIAAGRTTGNGMALMIIDLDHFKELNDTLGHEAGDLLLRQVGTRLRAVLRATDAAARLGGDEFGVLLSDLGDHDMALRVADKILAAISEPYAIRGLSLRVTASIGIALFPDHAQDDEQLMQHADVAMYDAKVARSGRAAYARDRDRHSRERLALAGELSRALAADEIEVHFQPKADARTHRVVGLEALARWRHPARGLLGPVEFVAVAEQAGLARQLTQRVLDLALRQVRAWRADGLDLHVAVNTTVADLQDAQFPNEVITALAAHGLPTSALVLEVTENTVLADPVRVGTVLAQLNELGIGLSLDDFGTGYSSLVHLKALPVQEVKVDRSFVAHMTSDATDAAIVQATIQLAHSIDLHVVAEGVEDSETWDALAEAGCELVQGYALSRPLPADELAPLLSVRGHVPDVA